MESNYHWLITIGLVASSVIAVTANFFLLILFYRSRSLRTVPNRFVINLLVTNLLSSVLLIPLLLVDQETAAPTPAAPTQLAAPIIEQDAAASTIQLIEPPPPPANATDPLCYLAQSTTSFVCTASIFSILLIGINQYLGVIHSLRYHVHVTSGKSNGLIAASWAVAALCALLSCLTRSDSSVWRFCRSRERPTDAARLLNTAYAFAYFLLVIAAPCVAICAIYLCIYAAARRNSERMRRADGYAPPVDGRAGLVRALRSVFRFGEETRAAKISVLVVFLVLVCYVPYGVTLVLCSEGVAVDTGPAFNYLSLVLLVFSNVISPFLFGYRNKRVKSEICRLAGRVPREPGRPPRAFVCGDIPEVIVTCKAEGERKGILQSWVGCDECNFIVVPDSCLNGEARGSFSSASTQISTED